MINLNPSQVFSLCKHAYDVQQGTNKATLETLRMALPFVDIGSVKLITATSGLFTPVSSGFGFMAQLNGGRSKEIVIATRGTDGMADVGTDINAALGYGPTGHSIHKGFGTTFKSYVQQPVLSWA